MTRIFGSQIPSTSGIRNMRLTALVPPGGREAPQLPGRHTGATMPSKTAHNPARNASLLDR